MTIVRIIVRTTVIKTFKSVIFPFGSKLPLERSSRALQLVWKRHKTVSGDVRLSPLLFLTCAGCSKDRKALMSQLQSVITQRQRQSAPISVN